MAGMKGRSGRKPKPEALKKLEGQRLRHKTATASFSSGPPKEPAGLRPIAQQAWRQTLQQLQAVPGLLSQCDQGALHLYADAWQLYHDASEQLQAEGSLTDERGKLHPCVVVMNQAADRILKTGALFGLSPSARSTLRLELPDADADGVDEVARLLKIRGA